MYLELCRICLPLAYFTSTVSFSPTHVVEMAGFPSFLRLNNIPLYIHMFFFIYASVDGHGLFLQLGCCGKCCSGHRQAGIFKTLISFFGINTHVGQTSVTIPTAMLVWSQPTKHHSCQGGNASLKPGVHSQRAAGALPAGTPQSSAGHRQGL